MYVQSSYSIGLFNLGSVLKTKFSPKHDDDLVDKLNYAYTTTMLLFCAMVVGGQQYFGSPLQCWIPAEFPGMWEFYSESYCFVENTYFVGLDEKVFPRTQEERESRELLYYQWVPIILCAQLILFLLPKTIWSSFNWRTGLIVNGLIESAKLVKQTGRKRSEFVKSNEDAGNYLVNLIKFNKEKQDLASHGIFTEHFKGTYVTNLYIFFKFLNLLNVLTQIVWLNMFFGYAYTFWGWGILMDLFNGVEWEHSGQFPRVTYCDVQIREIGANIRKKTFQCVLMLNMFNEKIFIFIWFWLFFLLILNSLNLGAWIYRSYNLGNIKSFVNKHLGYKSIEIEDHELEDFIQNMLFKDITTLLRLMEYNCGSLATTEVIFSIYDQYKKEEERKKNVNQQ